LAGGLSRIAGFLIAVLAGALALEYAIVYSGLFFPGALSTSIGVEEPFRRIVQAELLGVNVTFKARVFLPMKTGPVKVSIDSPAEEARGLGVLVVVGNSSFTCLIPCTLTVELESPFMLIDVYLLPPSEDDLGDYYGLEGSILIEVTAVAGGR